MGPVVSFTRPGAERPRDRRRTDPRGRGPDRRRRRDPGPGPGRFAGYWQNPEATAAAIDADGWYHTGDLGALRPTACSRSAGRKKDMLALPDGQKVYPEDVEAILREDDRLRDADGRGLAARARRLRVHAVLLMDDPALADDVVRSRQRSARRPSADPRHDRLAGPGPAPDPHPQGAQAGHPGPARRPRPPGTAPLARGRIGASGATPPMSEVDPVTAHHRQRRGARPATAVGRDGTPVERPRPRFPAPRGAARASSRRSSASSWTTTRSSRTPPSRTSSRSSMPARAGEAWPRFVALAALAGRPGRRAHLPGPADVPVRPPVLPGAHDRARTPRARRRPDPVHAEPLPAPGQRDHPHAASRSAIRWKLSVAAAADTIYDNPLQGVLASVIANAFPLQREGGVRRSLETARRAARSRVQRPHLPGRQADRRRAAAAVQGRGRTHRGRGRHPGRPGQAP